MSGREGARRTLETLITALTLTRPLMVSVTLAERMLAEPGGSLGHMPAKEMMMIVDGFLADNVMECRRGCVTNLFAVVDGVRLQVVADVGHDEEGGDVAQLLAPAVLFLKKPRRQRLGVEGAASER